MVCNFFVSHWAAGVLCTRTTGKKIVHYVEQTKRHTAFYFQRLFQMRHNLKQPFFLFLMFSFRRFLNMEYWRSLWVIAQRWHLCSAHFCSISNGFSRVAFTQKENLQHVVFDGLSLVHRLLVGFVYAIYGTVCIN